MSVSVEKYEKLKKQAYDWYEQLSNYKDEIKEIKKEIKKQQKLALLQEKTFNNQLHNLNEEHKREIEKLKIIFEKEQYKLQGEYERNLIDKNQDIKILEKDVQNYKERLQELKEEYRQRYKNNNN